MPDVPPTADPAIAEALARACTDGSWAKYDGPHHESLVESLKHQFQVSHARTVASGTLAVEIALRAAGVGPGDEVIQAAYDYDANFLSIHALGAMPVLVDVDPHSGQLDPDHLDSARSERTKAVLVSHLHGGLVPMTRVCHWAKPNGIAVIEDAAQAAGAIVDGQPAGSHGDYGILSFGGSKLLSAGRGGAILAQDAKRDHAVKRLLLRGNQHWAQISELQSLVLIPQLARLATDTQARSEAVRAWVRKLGFLPLAKLDGPDTPAFYKVGFWVDSGRDEWCAKMRSQGIALDPGFSALHIGRSPSRFRTAGPLLYVTRMHDQVAVLHHTMLEYRRILR